MQARPAAGVSTPAAPESMLSYRVDGAGLSALAFRGQSLLSRGEDGSLRMEEGAVLRHADGSTRSLPVGADAPPLSLPGREEVLLRYPWGTVQGRYSARADQLLLTLAIHNTTQATLAGLSVRLLQLQFPQPPQCTELDAGQFGMGGAPHSLGGASVSADPRATVPLIFLDYGDGALAFCSDSAVWPAVLRVSAATDPPGNTRIAFRVSPGEIAAGKSVRCTVSFRFGLPGATYQSLAGDVLRGYAAAFPFQVHWSDRRPIGELFLSTNAQPHPVSNPRGWFNNAADIDVTTPQGQAQFRERLLRYADESIRILREMNAQGMVTWDPEGQEFAQATYYGDPRLAGRLAPETEYKGTATLACLDAFFQKFRAAGLRVGICVRPQEIRFVNGAPRQEDSPDPLRTLQRKIAYARQRWGCTLFYIDSTVKGEVPLDADLFRQVARAFPDVLLMPENETLRYFAYSAPLNSFQHHTVTSTPPGVRAVYPRAFSVLLAGEGDVGGHRSELVAAVRRGDILLFHGWWPNPNNTLIKSIYEEAHRSAERLSAGGAAATARSQAPKRFLLAHYMPWFEAKPYRPDWGWHWTMNHFKPDQESGGKRDIASPYYPLIGPYDSADPDVLEYHALLMKLAGIDGVIVDWYGRTGFLDYGMIHQNVERLIPYLRKAGLKFAVCFEDQSAPKLLAAGKAGGTDGLVYGQEVMRWLGTNWFMDPAYVKLGTRPVFLVFGPQYYKDDVWSTLFAPLPTPPAFFTLHDRRGPADGAFDWPLPAVGSGLKAVDRFYARAAQWPAFIPAAFPRFHDIYQEAGVGASYGVIEDQGGRTYARTLERALQSNAQITQAVTWNDWGEGTILEPSREFGYRDLETTQRLRRKCLDPAFPYVAEDLRIPLELFRLRKQVKADLTAVRALDEAARLLFAGQIQEGRSRLIRLEPRQGKTGR